MKTKLMLVFAMFCMVFAFSYNANAQYMTGDVVFLKLGWVPTYTVSFDKDEDGETKKDVESSGFAVQGEYNLNLDGILLGFGLEYERVETELGEDYDDLKINNSFITPMVSVKLATEGGFYIGAGLSGKYLIGTEKMEGTYAGYPFEMEFKKTIDLWANGILGYHVPVAEGIFLDLEGRFGWNLTNKQFDKIDLTMNGTTEELNIKAKNAYDIAFYVGIGTRARGSEY